MDNLALNKPALQSSAAHWATSTDPAENARGGNNGEISRLAGFNTIKELDPWWQVDLGADYLIRKVVIHNSERNAYHLKHFSLLKSQDGVAWERFYSKRDETVFGKLDDQPWIVEVEGEHLARFVRVRIDGLNLLHFNECEIFGDIPDPELSGRLAAEAAERNARRATLPTGRNGYLTAVGDFNVFVDKDNYDARIVSAIDSGSYEQRERLLTETMVKPGDKVIEIGTAIGTVSMTAAAIVGAENVSTFDANPDIVADARENFQRNGLGGIRSHVGLLKNRRKIGPPGETADFHVSEAFWASRLELTDIHADIVKTVAVPVFCLEDEIAAHGANVLICDIEGGEVDLLTEADLSTIDRIIIETHYWAVGEAPTDALVRKLIIDGFSINLELSSFQILVFRR